MTEENSKLAESLNQLKEDAEKQMTGIEALKETAAAELLADIEKIESDGWRTILDIEALQQKIAKEQTDLLEN